MRHLFRLGDAVLNLLSGVPPIGPMLVRSFDQATAHKHVAELHAQLTEAHAETSRLETLLTAATRQRTGYEQTVEDDERRSRDLSADWATGRR
jgi:hypothetical protein